MISHEKALSLILRQCSRLPAVHVPTSQALGRVLARPLVAPWPFPRFDSSAVDGFAVNTADLASAGDGAPVELRLQGTVRAGASGLMRLRRGATIRILTGAPVPAGADAIVMQECVKEEKNRIRFIAPARRGENIRRTGEEFRKGAAMLRVGAVVTPPVLSLLAAAGKREVVVYERPRVALVVTGDELRPPGARLRRGQISDSNTPGLAGALAAMGLKPILVLRSGDERGEMTSALRRALARADMVISSGGVSVGESDLVKGVYASLGVRTVFWLVAIKPGKPVLFGRQGAKLVFGLPGNPVSAFVGFHLFVRPALLRMMGGSSAEVLLRVRLRGDVEKKAGRKEFLRGVLVRDAKGRLQAVPLKAQDSHMVGGLASADCLIHVPADEERMASGSRVTVSVLRWGML